MAKRYCLLTLVLPIMIMLAGCGSSSGGGGGGAGILNGTVIDLSSTPVSNADVFVDTLVTKTLSNGRYTFINAPGGDKIIKVLPLGFTSSYRMVTLPGGGTVNVPITIVASLDGKVTPIVKATGGLASNSDGRIKMIFPINSFNTTDATVNVVLTAVPKIAAPFTPPDMDEFVSFVVYAKPDNFTLSASAELMIPNLTGISTQDVPFYKFNTNTYEWEKFGIGHADPVTNTINVHTPFMGWISAIMQITPAPGTIIGKVTNGISPIAGANIWTQNAFDVSDSLGNYTLYFIPSGDATVYTSALGYSQISAHVQVTSKQTSTYNPVLSSVSQGNITGTVKPNGGAFIEGARIVESSGAVAYSDDYGRFTLYNISLGPTIITAYADGYLSSSESVTVHTAGQTVTAQTFILLFIGTPSPYSYDFESGDQGWATTGFWHNQDNTETTHWDTSHPLNRLTDWFSQSHGTGVLNQKVDLPDDGQIPSTRPGGSGTHYFWYGQNSSSSVEGSYIGTQWDMDTVEGSGGLSLLKNSGTLESPELDLRGYTFGKLGFWTWWEVEGVNPATGFDKMRIVVLPYPYTSATSLGYLNPLQDPSTGESVASQEYSSGGFDQPGVWVNHTFDISQFAGQKIKLRFVFDSVDDEFNGFRGWFIDDVSVTNSQYGVSNVNNLIKEIPEGRRKRRN